MKHSSDTDDGTAVTVTTSIGLAYVDMSKDETFDDYYRVSDAALYKAKKFGRNCVMVAHTPEAKKEFNPTPVARPALSEAVVSTRYV